MKESVEVTLVTGLNTQNSECVSIENRPSVELQLQELQLQELQCQQILPQPSEDEIRLLEALAQATREFDLNQLLASVPS